MSIVQEIIRKAQKFAFPVFFVALEYSLDPSAKVHGPLGNWTPADQLLPTEESANKLRKMFEVISDMTAKESLIRHMRKKVKSRPYPFFFLFDTDSVGTASILIRRST